MCSVEDKTNMEDKRMRSVGKKLERQIKSFSFFRIKRTRTKSRKKKNLKKKKGKERKMKNKRRRKKGGKSKKMRKIEKKNI